MARQSRPAALAAALLVVASACSSASPTAQPAPDASLAATASAGPVQSPAASLTPRVTQPPATGGMSDPSGPKASATAAAPRYSDTITIGLQGLQTRPVPLSNSALAYFPVAYDTFLAMLYDTVLRYDDQFRSIPALASEPCSVSESGREITCRLRDARFSDGTPLTAGDVKMTFDVLRSGGCPIAPGLVGCGEGPQLTATETPDEHTVTFHLAEPNSRFATEALSEVVIEPKDVLESQSAAIMDVATGIDPRPLRDLAERLGAIVQEQQSAGIPDCSAELPEAIDALERAGVSTVEDARADNLDPAGELDSCGLAVTFQSMASSVADAIDASDPIDRIALLHGLLPINWHPIGSGPWRLKDRELYDHMTFEINPFHVGGPPTTPTIVFRSYQDGPSAVQALRTHQVDWLRFFLNGVDDDVQAAAEIPGVRMQESPSPGYLAITINVRQGRLFDDVRLRKALRACIGLEDAVAVATRGTGIPTYAPVPAQSWVYNSDLPHPMRDTTLANDLIQEAGWTLGPDGVYTKEGRRLATTVIVNQLFPDRRHFMELVALEASDCGMDLTIRPRDFSQFAGSILTFPHIPPGETEPFDLYFGGWIDPPDGDLEVWGTGELSGPKNPDGLNLAGFRDARVDELLDHARISYDLESRARDYREIQSILADKVPVIPAWTPKSISAVDAGIFSTASPINQGSANWWWQVESLAKIGDGASTP